MKIRPAPTPKAKQAAIGLNCLVAIICLGVKSVLGGLGAAPASAVS
jgi:hypothetical protein